MYKKIETLGLGYGAIAAIPNNELQDLLRPAPAACRDGIKTGDRDYPGSCTIPIN